MKIKYYDGIVYDEHGRVCIGLGEFLKKTGAKVFRYPMYNFYVHCHVLFISDENCLIKSNFSESLMPLDSHEVFEVVK